MRLAAKVSRAMWNGKCPSFSLLKPPQAAALPPLIRQFSANSSSFTPNPVALEMIKYATSLAREQKTEESYARGLLVLEQCESTQTDGNSEGLVELARSTLLFERESHAEAIERLERLQGLSLASIGIRVAASEALAGIYLEHCREDAASAVADLALQILRSIKIETGDVGFEVLDGRIKALKGLIELLSSNLESALSIFEGIQGETFFSINTALSCGEFLHGRRKFSSAKELYQKVIQATSQIEDFGCPNNLGACNMTSKEVAIAAACALGQLEAHVGNFNDAEEILTTALKKTEGHYGPKHPKIGVILTCIALMYRLKAMADRSSSLLIQEGLFRRAIELLKAPPVEVAGSNENILRKDIIALARGGYAEMLLVQQSRKAEGGEIAAVGGNCLGKPMDVTGEALELSKSSPKVPVIDTRICRAL